MAREKRLQVRLNEDEWARLRAEACRRDVSMSEAIQDYIKSLSKGQAELNTINVLRDVFK